MRADKVLAAALKVPTKSRARLAHLLLRSLDGPPDRGVEAAWIKVAERRARELADGSVQAVDAEVVFRRIRRRLRQRRR